MRFQCSSASRKFLNRRRLDRRVRHDVWFQCSSASRKFLNVRCPTRPVEVKRRFSALQRAENSSMVSSISLSTQLARFQCSSASRKFLNATPACCLSESRLRFSALQRAENSSINAESAMVVQRFGFSALQRAENSSMAYRKQRNRFGNRFQCSSASRKFLNENGGGANTDEIQVSVLFSEPKIPQCFELQLRDDYAESFSALQRAENSSISIAGAVIRQPEQFQCSSASRKFLNCRRLRMSHSGVVAVSVLFSEPKIPQCGSFSRLRRTYWRVSVLFSEPKIPQYGCANQND